MDYLVGVDLGGTKIRTALAGVDGEVIAEVEVPTGAPGGVEQVVENILATVRQVEDKAGPGKLAALGLGCPGPLDTRRGIIHFAPNLNWHDVPLKDILAPRLGCPVYIDNDANLAAWGEYARGAGRGVRHFVYVTVSTGIGAGLVLDGHIYRGAKDAAGEIGHMTVDHNGPLCRCGRRGCLEALASGTAIAARAREMVGQRQGQAILKLAGGDAGAISARVVDMAARAGDREACLILEEAAGYLGRGLAGVITMLNPALVAVGGGVMKSREEFWLQVQEEAAHWTLSAAWQRVKLVRAALGGRSGVLGAVALAKSGISLPGEKYRGEYD